MWNVGVYLLLGLSNLTDDTQEMDDMHGVYKPRTYRSTMRCKTEKIKLRVDMRRKVELNRSVAEDSQGVDVDSFDNDCESERRKSVCIATLSCNKLSFIVNGKPDDPIEIRPFDYTSTKQFISKSWCNFG